MLRAIAKPSCNSLLDLQTRSRIAPTAHELHRSDPIAGFEFSAEVVVVSVMQSKCDPLYLMLFAEQQELSLLQSLLFQPNRG